MCFIRIKPNSVVTNSRHKHPRIYELEGDKSLHMLEAAEIGGFMTCRINLYTDAAPQYKKIENDFK